MPSLPLELERLIFELAALQDTDRNNRVRIMLVAKRVYEWIRPILYRVAIARPSTLTIQDWKNTNVSDVGQFVRHLLTLKKFQVLDLLSACPNVESLAIWYPAPLSLEVFERIKDMPLRMLSAKLTPDEVITNYQALKNITHLELVVLKSSTWGDCKALVKLPRLTHLCLDISFEDGVVPDPLKHCPSLRVLIYLVADSESLKLHTIESGDPRFLVFEDCMRIEDCIAEWKCTANGQIGYWELADIIIRARNDKHFKDNSTFTFSRKTWMDSLNDDGMRWYKEWSR